MSFKKNLEPLEKSFTSFKVHKKFTFTEVDSGSGVFAVPIIQGTDSNLYGFSKSTAQSKTISGSVFYKTPTYHVVNQLYYKDIRTMLGHVDLYRGVPKISSSNAIVEYTYNDNLQNTGQKLRRPYTRQLGATATVISLPQKFYGEGIKPGSIKLTDNSTDVTLVLRDDTRGNLYDIDYSGSYSTRTPTAKDSGSLVGNVFYNDGLVVITSTKKPYNTVGTTEGTDGFSIDFESTQTIYQREYVCVVGENDLQFTTNKSARVGRSGSVAIGAFPKTDYTNTTEDDYPYVLTGFATSSYKTNGYKIGTEFIGETTHSEFAPYVTNIGLYNDRNELVAVGKPAAPIKNEKDLALTFVVRFDTN